MNQSFRTPENLKIECTSWGAYEMGEIGKAESSYASCWMPALRLTRFGIGEAELEIEYHYE